MIPEVQEEGRPWLGLSTESLTAADWENGIVQIQLVSFAGPPGGHFALFQNDGITNHVHFQTADGVGVEDVYRTQGLTGPGFPAHIHAHANWSFTRPGLYRLGLRFSGRHVTDGPKEATANFLVEVARPAPLVSLVRATDGTVSLRFPTELGASYHIQRQDNLEPSAWTSAGSFAGTGQPMDQPIPLNAGSAFYRVMVE
jgi:surface-anchored protein